MRNELLVEALQNLEKKYVDMFEELSNDISSIGSESSICLEGLNDRLQNVETTLMNTQRQVLELTNLFQDVAQTQNQLEKAVNERMSQLLKEQESMSKQIEQQLRRLNR